jgi:hypothetical protein
MNGAGGISGLIGTRTHGFRHRSTVPEPTTIPRASKKQVITNNFASKDGVFWDVTPCGSCKTDVSEELSAFIRVTRIGELGTTLAVTSNQPTRLSP